MDSSRILLEAIALRRCIAAQYNRTEVLLAPHILYTKHDALHIDAVTIAREGKPPREPKIGTFRVSGLGDLRVTEQPFEPSALFEPEAERYEGVALFAIEASTA